MKNKKQVTKKAVQNYVKSKGYRLPHGYEVVVRKKRLKKK